MEVEFLYNCDECDFFTHSYGYYKTHRKVRHIDEGMIYKCDICLQTFTFPFGLKKHKEELHESKILFYCNYCNHISNSARNLNRHEQKHINPEKKIRQTSKSCPYCNKIVSIRQFADHVEKVHDIRTDTNFKFSCDVCPYKAETEVVLKKHVVMKHAPVQWSCKLCHYKTPFEVKLNIHQARKHSEVRCDQCQFSTTCKTKLKCHKDSKHGGSLSCEKCPFRASNLWTMGKHRLEKHDEKLFCYICKYEAESLPDCLDHALQQHRMKTYTCSECDFITGKKSNLASHLSKEHNVANTREIYKCDICEFQSVGKVSFNKHMKTHKEKETDTKLQLQCPKCDFQTLAKKYLNKHLKSHKEKERDPIECFKCDFKADRKSQLRLHMKDSHPGQMSVYKCALCRYNTQNFALLEKHQDKHQGEEKPSIKTKRRKYEKKMDREVGIPSLSEIDSMIDSMKMNQEYFESGQVSQVKTESAEKETKMSSYVCPISSCVFLTSILTDKIISDHFSTNHSDIETKDWNFLPLI